MINKNFIFKIGLSLIHHDNIASYLMIFSGTSSQFRHNNSQLKSNDVGVLQQQIKNLDMRQPTVSPGIESTKSSFFMSNQQRPNGHLISLNSASSEQESVRYYSFNIKIDF